MRKIALGILAALAVSVLGVCCQSPTSPSQDPIVGTWNMLSMTTGGVTTTVTPGSSVLSAQYIFTNTHTWTANATTVGIQTTSAGTWSVSGGIYSITPASGASFTGAISGGILTFTQSQNSVTVAITLGLAVPTYSLTPGTVPNGTMTPATATTVNAGAATPITATPNSGYGFSGWSATPTGNATFASSSSSSTTVILSGNATITPIFSATVTYTGNGATSGTAPIDSSEYNQGQTVKVLGNVGNLSKSGFSFGGWTTNPNSSGPSASYFPGNTFSMGSSNMALYAIWIPQNFTFKWTQIYFNNSLIGTNEVDLTGYVTAPTGAVIIPPGVTAIDSSALSNCSGITTFSIPSSVTYLSIYMLEGCTGLTTITVDSTNPNYVVSSGAIFDKTMTILVYVLSATTSYSIPTSVTSIGFGAFADCLALTNVTIPTSVTTIDANAFQSCNALTNITIPSSVTSIGTFAFNYAGLTSLTIPQSVTSIGSCAFWYCTSLSSVTMNSSTPPSLPASSGAFGGEPSGFLIHVPTTAAVTAYDAATGWSTYINNIVTP